MSVLSKQEIIKHFKAGNIVIDPFNKDNLTTTSYDVRLGKYFYRQNQIKLTQTLNPFYEKSLKKLYSEVEEAISVLEIKSKRNPFYGLTSRDKVILIAPNETILANTVEFIGAKNGDKNLPAVVSSMRARSSIGRLGIAVCKCAGWGDIGYVNRWTMEITNFSSVIIPLPVGMRIAQIVFHTATPLEGADSYETKGKYQKTADLRKLKKSWKPEDMLPKLYKDRDLGKFSKFAK